MSEIGDRHRAYAKGLEEAIYMLQDYDALAIRQIVGFLKRRADGMVELAENADNKANAKVVSGSHPIGAS